MWYLDLLKIAGTKAVGKFIDAYGGDSRKELRKLLLGEDKTVEEYLERIESSVKHLTEIAEAGELRQLFVAYNDADRELDVLQQGYKTYRKRPVTDKERQNACAGIVDQWGAFHQVREMLAALTHLNRPKNTSFLGEYASVLARDYTDVFTFCDRIGKVVEHLRVTMIEAAVLRDLAFTDLVDKTVAGDLPIQDDDVYVLDDEFKKVAGAAIELRDALLDAAQSGRPIKMRHVETSRFVTAYPLGHPTSQDKPFGKYTQPFTNGGMPQIYAETSATGQVRQYTVVVPFGRGSSTTTKVELTADTQIWTVSLAHENEEPAAAVLRHRATNKALTGVKDGCVFLEDIDLSRPDQQWLPILAQDRAGKPLRGVCLLKHRAKGLALDSDGVRVYADDRKPAYDNLYMRWDVVGRRTTLGPGEYLGPEDQLSSASGQFLLRYTLQGKLELANVASGKVTWRSHTKAGAAWRCYMQGEDGQLVAYASEGVVAWANGVSGPKFAGSRLVLGDDGSLTVLGKDGQKVWTAKIS